MIAIQKEADGHAPTEMNRQTSRDQIVNASSINLNLSLNLSLSPNVFYSRLTLSMSLNAMISGSAMQHLTHRYLKAQ